MFALKKLQSRRWRSVAVLLTVLACTAGAGVFTHEIVSRELAKRSIARVELKAWTMARDVRGQLAALMHEIDVFLRSSSLATLQTSAAREEVGWYCRHASLCVWAAIADGGGRVLASSDGALLGQRVAASGPLASERVAASGPLASGRLQPHLSGPMSGADVGLGGELESRRVALLTVPFLNGGVTELILAVDLTKLADAGRSIARGRLAYTPTLLLVPQGGLHDVSTGAASPVDPRGAPEDAAAVDDRGVRYYLGTADVGQISDTLNVPWTVIGFQDAAATMGVLETLTWSNALWGGGCLLALAACSWLLAVGVPRPGAALYGEVRRMLEAARGPGALEGAAQRIERELAHEDSEFGDRDVVLGLLARDARQVVTVLERLPLPILLTAADGSIRYANAAYERLVGLPRDALLGTAPATRRRDAGAPLGGLPSEASATTDLATAGGQYRAVTWHATSTFNDDGTLAGTICVVTDRHLEVQAHEQLGRVLETMEEGLALLDENGRVRLVNSALAKMAGVPVSHMLGKTMGEVVPELWWPDGGRVPVAERPWARLQSGEQEVVHEVMLFGGSAPRIVTATNAKAMRDQHGNILGAVLTCTDITGIHQAERELAKNRAQLAAIVTGANDAIVSADEHGHVTIFNPAAQRVFALAAAQVVGRPVADLLSISASGRELLAKIREAKAGPNRDIVNFVFNRRDGEQLHLDVALSFTSINDLPVSTAIFRDVTERVANDRAMEVARQELHELTHRLMEQERETTRNLAQALHDELGQTITALGLQFQALRSVHLRTVPDLGSGFAALIQRCHEQLRTVLKELRPPMLREFGLVEALENELQQRRLAKMPGKVSLHVDPVLLKARWPHDVEYAAFMVAREAMRNASAHAPGAEVIVSIDGDANSLRMDVCDEGAGMDIATVSKRSGHLGLVGMRERALAIGAVLDIRSSPGMGTTVSLEWNAQ